MKKEMIVSVFGSSRPREMIPSMLRRASWGARWRKKVLRYAPVAMAERWKRCLAAPKKLAARLTE